MKNGLEHLARKNAVLRELINDALSGGIKTTTSRDALLLPSDDLDSVLTLLWSEDLSPFASFSIALVAADGIHVGAGHQVVLSALSQPILCEWQKESLLSCIMSNSAKPRLPLDPVLLPFVMQAFEIFEEDSRFNTFLSRNFDNFSNDLRRRASDYLLIRARGPRSYNVDSLFLLYDRDEFATPVLARLKSWLEAGDFYKADLEVVYELAAMDFVKRGELARFDQILKQQWAQLLQQPEGVRLLKHVAGAINSAHPRCRVMASELNTFDRLWSRGESQPPCALVSALPWIQFSIDLERVADIIEEEGREKHRTSPSSFDLPKVAIQAVLQTFLSLEKQRPEQLHKLQFESA